MYNKTQIINRLKETNFDKKSYWLVAGAAMVLYGVKEYTGDIDLGCNKELADTLQETGYKTDITADGNRRIEYDSDIEIFENWRLGDINVVESIPVVSIEGLIMMKKELGREKDLKDIKMINKFIMNKKECH